MPSDSYNGRRKIKGKSKKRSKKSSKRRTSRKNTSKGYDMIDTEFMSNLNMNMKNQQQKSIVIGRTKPQPNLPSCP